MSHRRFWSFEDDDEPPPLPTPNPDLTASIINAITCTTSATTIGTTVTTRPSLEQSIHCFRAVSFRRPPQNPSQQRSRARLTAAERTKVLGVRRQGACLRCRRLKIEVFSDIICRNGR